MTDKTIYRLAGIFGLVACGITLMEFPLWMIGGMVPSFADSTTFSSFVTRTSSLYITRTLMDMLIYVLLTCFLVILRKLFIDTDGKIEWLATLFLAFSLIYITITLIADSISGSMGLDVTNGANPLVLRTMVEMTLLIFGSVGLIMIGAMMTVAGILIFQTGALPKWLGWVSFVVALANYAFVPTMYFGTDPAQFYSAAGFGAALMATFPFLIWIAITSILMIRRSSKMEDIYEHERTYPDSPG